MWDKKWKTVLEFKNKNNSTKTCTVLMGKNYDG